ncbi:hypothetical protein JB92DRAFT_510735 [Gautieria morchelliformis]|nr:hypothetical protein JB92DRAFT_510735 [Gautieria morchelliformis]
MLGIALSLLFISGATCSSINMTQITVPTPPATLPSLSASLATLPLSAPLPNGTMEIQCPPGPAEEQECSFRSCCSNNEIIYLAIVQLCGGPPDSFGQAFTQYEINNIIALCHFNGHSVDNVQLLLTPNASAILDSMNRPDEQLRKQHAIYRALQIIGGHIGLPIILLFSIFSKTAQRDLTFLNFCFTWIFSSITFSLGLYRLGPECLNQAALVSGAQVMTDTAMCALIVQLWLDFRAAIHGPRSPRQIRWTKATLLAAPYVALLAFSLAALGAPVNFTGPLVAARMNFYCMLFDVSISQHPFLISQYTVLLAILIVTLIFDACIIHILYRRWRFFQRTAGKALGVPLSVAFRVLIFCAYRLVVAVAYVASILNTQGINVLNGPKGPNETNFSIPVWVDMLQAGTPLVAFLIFGTSKEFLDALMFWRWVNPILAISMCCRRRSSVTPR